jgi:ABC-type proline/glycine betaine transport system permease subunit
MIDATTYLSLILTTFAISVLLGVALGFHLAMDAAMRHAIRLQEESRREHLKVA